MSLLFVGVQWFDLKKKKHLNIINKPLDPKLDVILPLVFLKFNAIAISSQNGQVTIFKANSAKALQVLDHNGKFWQLTFKLLLMSLGAMIQTLVRFGS